MNNKELIILSFFSIKNLDFRNFKFSQKDILGCTNFSITLNNIDIVIDLINQQLDFYEYNDIKYNFKFSTDPKNKEVDLSLQLLKRPEDVVENIDEIDPTDYNTILNNIDLFDEKYRLIIQSDNGKDLSQFVNFYCVCNNGIISQSEDFEELPFLDFLEEHYQNKDYWKIKSNVA